MFLKSMSEIGYWTYRARIFENNKLSLKVWEPAFIHLFHGGPPMRYVNHATMGDDGHVPKWVLKLVETKRDAESLYSEIDAPEPEQLVRSLNVKIQTRRRV